MSSLVLSREEVRQLDRLATEEYGMPGVVLMENAGRGVAALLQSQGVRGPVVICCGKGNNGGDGFVVARHLDNAGIPVRILLFAQPDRLLGDAATNYRIVHKGGLEIALYDENAVAGRLASELVSAEWIVDGLFGTGLTGQVRPPFDGIIHIINQAGKKVLAIDLPSGLDANTGRSLGATIRADQTATFVAAKTGFGEPAAKSWLGSVQIIDIGIPSALLRRAHRKALFAAASGGVARLPST